MAKQLQRLMLWRERIFFRSLSLKCLLCLSSSVLLFVQVCACMCVCVLACIHVCVCNSPQSSVSQARLVIIGNDLPSESLEFKWSDLWVRQRSFTHQHSKVTSPRLMTCAYCLLGQQMLQCARRQAHLFSTWAEDSKLGPLRCDWSMLATTPPCVCARMHTCVCRAWICTYLPACFSCPLRY